MIADRSTSGHSVGWIPAIIFNALLVLIPLIAVNVLVAGFSNAPHNLPPTAEILAETRKTMNSAFDGLTRNDENARAEWAALVAEQLDERNLSAARGFLLAAPHMLSVGDQRAIRAAAQAEPSGTADQRLLRAALLFLPSDIRVGYETSTRPRGTNLVNLLDDDPDPATGADADPQNADDETLQNQPFSRLSGLQRKARFSVLGTPDDLVNRSRDWMRGNYQHAFELRITGLAMATPPSATGLSQEDLFEAASILKLAWSSDRLQPQYATLLEQRIEAALPDDVLLANLEAAFDDFSNISERASRIQDAFAKSVDPRAAIRLGPEFEQIAEIARETSPLGAISLLEHASTSVDIRRARLIAQAGGDRAVALTSQLGPQALHMTGSGIRWSTSIVLSIMGLTAAGLALFLSALSALGRMIFGRRLTAIL